MLKKSGLSEQLTNLPNGPDVPELHRVLSQALEQRGKHLQLTWRVPAKMTQFTLDVVRNFKAGDLQWRLYAMKGGKQDLVFDFTSLDVLLVHNKIISACAEYLPVARQQSKQATTETTSRADSPTQPSWQAVSTAQAEAVDAEIVRLDEDQASADAESLQAKRDAEIERVWQESELPPAERRTAQPKEPRAPKDSFETQERTHQLPNKPQPPPPSADANTAATSRSGQISAQPPAQPVASTPQPVSSRAVPGFGTLADCPLPQLMQSIASARLTGKLEIRDSHTSAFIYVQDGIPVDATAAGIVGDDAIIELLTWTEGQYIFEPRIPRNRQTIRQGFDTLLIQSRQLADRVNYLRSAGVLPTSFLHPKNAKLSEIDFVQKVAKGAPVDLATMANFYRHVNGQQTIEDMSQLLPISRIQLVQIVYHLVVNDLVSISNKTEVQNKITMKPRAIDNLAIESVMMALRRAETGMFIYPAFLYFLEQEYFRSYRAGNPLSVVVFEMRQIVPNGAELVRQQLPNSAIVDAALRISQLKRHQDLLAHYDAFDYAMLLPNTKAGGAQIFANRIVKCLTASPLSGMEPNRLALSLGSASIPEDFVDLSALLGAADAAMNRAREVGQHLVMFRDIKDLIV